MASSIAAESWGVEVKCGKTVRVFPGEGKSIHITLATLGKAKKGTRTGLVHLKLKVGDSTLIMGSLCVEKIPLMSCRLVIEQPFELSHDWEDGSVHFSGLSVDYICDDDDDDEPDLPDSDDSDDSDEEDEPRTTRREVKSDAKGSVGNPGSSANSNGNGSENSEQLEESEFNLEVDEEAPKKIESSKMRTSKSATKAPVSVKEARPRAPQKTDAKSSAGKPGSSAKHKGNGSDDSEQLDDLKRLQKDDRKVTRKKLESSKKRHSESTNGTPVSAKKAKLDAPQKTDGKMAIGHVAKTSHLSKNDGKTLTRCSKSKSSKSAGKWKSSFQLEVTSQSHSSAEHGVTK